MDARSFLEIAVKGLPGGLILVDLKGRVQAVNETAEQLLELPSAISAGTPCERLLSGHPKVAKAILAACESLEAANRQELTTQRSSGEKMVLGYGTLIIRSREGEPVGVGLTFQDITRMIPLMDSHRFLDISRTCRAA
jgi:nitrogen fixation/metabolism regulation signal transduction histidine kinase